jgi:hypothetical protein
MRDKTAPVLSSLRKGAHDTENRGGDSQKSSPAPSKVPTPVLCWADSVPDEFKTPVFGGRRPPEEFDEGDVPTVDPARIRTGSESSCSMRDILQAEDYKAQGYFREWASYYIEKNVAGPVSQFSPPPPPMRLHDQLDVTYHGMMIRWFQYVLVWVEEAFDAYGVALPLPPPPPPPAPHNTAHIPYSFPQWIQRVDYWHSYIVREYYQNPNRPSDGLLQLPPHNKQSSQPQGPSPPPPSHHQHLHSVHHPLHHHHHRHATDLPRGV